MDRINKISYFSAFSGIGGFELGINDACYNGDTKIYPQCVGFSEIDKYAEEIYLKHFNHKSYGDISKINPNELEDFDLFVGGFPCQSFSIAGKRGGFEDTRGTLFFEIARIIREKQPRFLLLENVKGLLSHEKGETFLTILSTLNELGYDVEWQVLNSKDFGVPQNRERVFIVGYSRGSGGRKIFPIERNGSQDPEQSKENLIYWKNSKEKWVKEKRGYTPTIKTQSDLCRQPLIEITQNVADAQRIYDPKGISKTLKANGGGQGAKTGLYAVMTPDRHNKKQNGRQIKEDGEPMFTLTAQDKHGISDGYRIRRLTPIECERLQGFPDNWTAGVSDTQRYKQLGNAVTVNVIRAIMHKMVKIFQ